MSDIDLPGQGLGRIEYHDPRNREWPARGTVRIAGLAKPNPWPWYTRDVYDQGSTPSCTAHAAVGLLRTTPYRPLISPVFSQYDELAERVALYKAAQKVDNIPGEDYDGTSTDAPLRVLRDRKVISEWRWLFGIDDVRHWLQYEGPVVVGTSWFDSMFDPVDGRILVDTSSELAGGHCYRLIWHHKRNGTDWAIRMVNSWGPSWGQTGRAWIFEDDLAGLLEDGGEAATVVLP